MAKLSKKQIGWVHDFLETGNQRQAALKNYNTKSISNADHLALVNRNNPKIRSYMQKILDKSGVDENYIADKYKQYIDASVQKTVLANIKPSDGIRALENVGKLHDLYPAKRIEKKSASVTFRADLHKMSEQELLKELTKLQLQIKQFKSLTKKTNEIQDVKTV